MAEPLSQPEPLRLYRSPDAILKDWVQEHLEQTGELSAALLYPEALQIFSNDRLFMNALFEDALLLRLQDAVAKTVMANRGRLIPLGRGMITEEKVQALMAQKVVRWFEATMDGEYIQLLKFTKVQLVETIQRQRMALDSQQRRLNFLEEIANGLPEGQTVEEVYSIPQLAEIWRKHFE